MFGVHRNRYQFIHYSEFVILFPTPNIHQPKKFHKGEITFNLDDSP